MGADDYLPKTFCTRELPARLRAVLRRSRTPPGAPSANRTAGPLNVGGWSIDAGARQAKLSGETLPLIRQEFDPLLVLARSCGRVKTREQLLLEVADRNFEVFDRSIDVQIASLRKKPADDAKAPRWIVTIRGVGFTMKCPEPA